MNAKRAVAFGFGTPVRLKAWKNRAREPREELIKRDAIPTAPAAHVSGETQEVNIIHPPSVSYVDNQPVYLSSKHSWKRHTHSDKQAVHHAHAQVRIHTHAHVRAPYGNDCGARMCAKWGSVENSLHTWRTACL